MYQTVNMPLAAFLVARGHDVTSLNPVKTNSDQFAFGFEDGDCEHLEKAFKYGDDTVSAREFWRACRRLKALIYGDIAI